MSALFELTWRTQVIFVGGYLAYVIAYSGRRGSHGPTDILGIILCFGGLGLLVTGIFEAIYSATQPNEERASFLIFDWLQKPIFLPEQSFFQNYRDYLIGIIGVFIPLVAAVIWRGFLNNLAFDFIRFVTKTSEDGLPTAWSTIIQRQGLDYAQLVVTLKSGVAYESYPLGNFNGLPNGPCVLGSDGSIGMYVTFITDNDGEGRAVEAITDPDGHRMTYIPNTEIAEIDLRRIRKTEAKSLSTTVAAAART